MNLDDIKDTFPLETDIPIFSFIHLLQPYPPFIYRADCSIRTSANIPEWNTKKLFKWSASLEDEVFKKYYIDNVKCINQKIISFINWIESKYSDSIIIVQGSNGLGFLYRKEDIYTRSMETVKKEEIRQELSILNLIKIPKKCKKNLYHNMTPINTFRLIIACLENKEPNFIVDKLYNLQSGGDGKIKKNLFNIKD
tara:strand:- start:30 stop:617 length:588 start_codon:yes stop_codon:yes gene_type:complete